MDVIESLRKYEEEDQKKIMLTLKTVQDKGWRHIEDPFLFHIILGVKIKIPKTEII